LVKAGLSLRVPALLFKNQVLRYARLRRASLGMTSALAQGEREKKISREWKICALVVQGNDDNAKALSS
jgi:hypothetical protein